MSKSPSVLSYAPADRLSSSEHFDLVPIQQTLSRIAHRPIVGLDRRRLLRNARSVIEAIEDKMPLSVMAARCESLVWAAVVIIKKVEMRERAWNR